jgi:Tfp pilus assembly protein PilN
MRIQINLASEPFRRDRPLVFASTMVAVLLTGVLGLLIFLAISERERSAESRQVLGRLEGQMSAIAADEARLQGVLRQPQNAEVLDRSVLLNGLLARKGVSWTKIFSDLEEVAPHNVRLVQVRPQINPQNQVSLDMTVAAQSTEPIETFFEKLEGSPVFGAVTIMNSLPPSQSEPLIRYRVSVNYAQKL